MPLLAAARKVIDGYVIETPKRFELEDKDFVTKVVYPAGPIVGQIADVTTTLYGLDHGLVEANPVMKGMVKNLPLFAVTKLAIGIGMAAVVNRIHDKGMKRTASILGSLAGFVPAASNMIQLSKK